MFTSFHLLFVGGVDKLLRFAPLPGQVLGGQVTGGQEDYLPDLQSIILNCYGLDG